MRFKRRFSAGFFVAILLALSMFILGVRGIKLENMKFGGTIAAVSEDWKSITVHGARVSKVVISSGTKIVDEKGTVLGMRSLRSKLSIEVEGWHDPNGPLYARKIIVKMPKQKP
jgi:hypothetical protein